MTDQELARSSFAPFESSQLEETRAYLADFLCKPDLAPVGDRANFRTCSRNIDFGNVHLLTLSFGTRMRLDVDLTDAGVKGSILIMICLKGRATIEIDGIKTEITAETGFISRPRGHMSAELSDDCERVLIYGDARSFKLPGYGSLVGLDFSRPHLKPFLDQIRMIAGSPHFIAALREDPAVAEATGTLLDQLLRYGLQAASKDQLERSIAAGRVVRAESVIRQRAEDPLQVGDIADAVGVPVRTLQNNFRLYRNYTPMEYLRAVRLSLARERLTSADADTLIVNVALDCGFSHLGRFASEYQARYGETPSATLRRRRAVLSTTRSRYQRTVEHAGMPA